ncbi:MAG: hypothetical protein L0H83_05375 [Salinisphaera sp.]|nr:hypothetical protein [Salinisphaera sp.]
MSPPNKEKHWLDDPAHVNRLVHTLWVACAIAVLAGLFFTPHPHFGWDGWFGFFCAFGFFAYCLIVFSAKGLRRLIARREGYYGEGSGDELGNAGTQRAHGDD